MSKKERIAYIAKKNKQRENLIYMANLANASKQFEDLIMYVRRLIKIMRARFKGKDLSSQEKHLFHAAFKNNLLCKRR